MSPLQRTTSASFPGDARFELRRELGSGGYGKVYEAFDRQRGEELALKLLHRGEPEALLAFKREFRALADLSHPNLASLYELFGADDRYYFTMELVRGQSFIDYVRPPLQGEHDWARDFGPTIASDHEDDTRPSTSEDEDEYDSPRRAGRIDPERLTAALLQLTEGVIALHEAGKLHRDLKPSNVLVDETGRVVVLDFGLVQELDLSHHDAYVVGTPAYMSPEQARGAAPSPATDWYCVGVMLYEALTGQLPYRGQAMHVMMRKQEDDPPPPRSIDSTLPEELERLCLGLLSRDAVQRLTGQDILETLGCVARHRSGSVAIPSLEGVSPLIGREAQAATLHGRLDDLRAGRGAIVHVHGATGMGKSALIRQFLREAARGNDLTILKGRCYEQETLPYKALDPLIDALSRHLRALDRARLKSLLPQHMADLVQLFPVLTGLQRDSRAQDDLEPHQRRERGFLALRQLLSRVAQQRPLLIWLDDLHWADADSAAAVATLLAPPDPPPLLLVASYRQQIGQGAQLIEALGTVTVGDLPSGDALMAHHIAVGPLNEDDARRLTSIALGETPHSPSCVISIVKQAGGCPFVIERLVNFVKTSGEPQDDRSINLRRALEASLSQLPSAAAELLQLCALAARPIPRDVLGDVARTSHLAEPLRLLRSARLIGGEGSSEADTIEPYHDQLREAVKASVDATLASELHLRLATAWRRHDAEPELLATHYAAAGARADAATFAIKAAQRADNLLAFDRAAGLYRWGIELGEADQRDKLLVPLAEALSNAGRGPEAARAFEEAAAATRDRALALTRRAAEEWLRSGYVDEGLRQLEQTLAALDMRLPLSPRRALASLAYQRARLKLRGLDFAAQEERAIGAQQLERLDACWAVANGLGMVDTVRAADFQSRHLILALDSGSKPRIARALAIEAPFSALRGCAAADATRALLDRARVLIEELDDPYLRGLSDLVSALVAYLEGRFSAIEKSALAGEEQLQRARGAAWELANLRLFWAEGMAHSGRLRELAKRLPLLVRAARDRGNRYEETGLRVVGHILYLARDEAATARSALAATMERYGQREGHIHQFREVFAEAQIAIYEGEGAAALETLEARWPTLRRLQLLRAQVARLAARLLRGRAALAASTQTSPNATKLRELALRQATLVQKEGAPWATPLADLLRAGAAAHGDGGAAADYLELAEEALREQELWLYAAAARLMRGKLTKDGSLLASAEAELAREGVWNASRFAAMLVPGI